ncbi:MAG: helix-turn-helix domain-containing protein, partial [Bacillota bacterium]|nr:helix-turn-helix domain-containing protein [Bacillota bacterium]
KTGAGKEPERDASLFELLRRLRAQTARDECVPPFMIFSDASLNDMARRYPTQDDEMLQIMGVGSHKLEKYGAAFIKVISDYVSEHGINADKSLFGAAKKPERPRQPHTGDTHAVTYEMYRNGLSIAEIAEKRGFTVNTIEGHLLDCHFSGLEVDLSAFIDPSKEDLIVEAVKKAGGGKLKPIKESLPEEISYSAIRYVIRKNKLYGVKGQED